MEALKCQKKATFLGVQWILSSLGAAARAYCSSISNHLQLLVREAGRCPEAVVLQVAQHTLVCQTALNFRYFSVKTVFWSTSLPQCHNTEWMTLYINEHFGAWGRRYPSPLLVVQTVEIPSAPEECSSVMSQDPAGSRPWLQEKLPCLGCSVSMHRTITPLPWRAGAAAGASLPCCRAEPTAPEPP